MENQTNDFMTQKGYDQKNNSLITPSMEDYLEMIYRQYKKGVQTRIGSLADKLNVKPSSASKMIVNLKNAGLVDYQKYGIVKITDYGIDTGKYLLYRHNVLNEFFCLINNSKNEAEQIEHFMKKNTVINMEKLIPILKEISSHNKYPPT